MKEDRRLKIIILLAFIILLVIPIIFVLVDKKKEDIRPDNEIFSSEYTKVGIDNVFTYRNSEEIINILEKGTGIVFLGFPECPWCQQYAVYLNEVARQNGITKIYYYNIKADRDQKNDTYKKIVSILGNNLATDDEGNARIFVPDVTFVAKGQIIGHDNESSYDVTGTPEDYWTQDKIDALKNKLTSLAQQVKENECSSCEA